LKKSYLTPVLALAKLQKYCAYQDRCIYEAQNKLSLLGIRGREADAIIAELLNENFLNEERFARSFCRGKFYMKGWGKIKIKGELYKKRVDNLLISKGMEEIELKDYRNQLAKILRKKHARLKGQDWYTLKVKLARHALSKGYEIELIYHMIDELKLNNKP